MDNTHIQYLLKHQSYPDTRKTPPRLIETHISWVLLTDHFAFKLKKPVNFSFLDFSSLEKRKHFCEEELRLNRRLAPEVYLRIWPVYHSPSGVYQISDKAEGEVVDYALQMKRLDPGKQMDVFLKKGKVSPASLRQLAIDLAHFHQKAPVIHPEHWLEHHHIVFNHIKEALKATAEYCPDDIREAIGQAIDFSDRFLEQHEPLFLERIDNQLIREVHGDLHAGNIFLYDPPIVFDCIEFNADFRQIDLLSEIAFLCMDMEHYGFPELSRYFYTQYTTAIERLLEVSVGHEALWIYYKLSRANVRAKVYLLASLEGEKGSEKRDTAMEKATQYVSLMERYLEELKRG